MSAIDGEAEPDLNEYINEAIQSEEHYEQFGGGCCILFVQSPQ